MTFWQWFQRDGGKVFTFISLASLSLKTVDGLPLWLSQSILVAGLLASIAHNVFFPNSPGPTAPKASP